AGRRSPGCGSSPAPARRAPGRAGRGSRRWWSPGARRRRRRWRPREAARGAPPLRPLRPPRAPRAWLRSASQTLGVATTSGVSDGAAAELEDDILAEMVEQLVHLAGVDAAGGDRHDARHRRPVLIEVDAVPRVGRHVVEAERVVVAPDDGRVALQLADDRPG